MAITITRDLNVVSVGVPPVIHLSQYDSDFTLVFNLYASTGAFTMPTGTTAEIRGTKRDGNGYDAAASVSGSTVTVTGDEQMTAIAGQNMFEIATYYNNKRLNTINFILDVERAALDADTITSESVLRELDAIIQGAATATQAAEDAEDAADRAEEAADDLSGTVQQVATNTQDIAGLKDDLEHIEPGLSAEAKEALLACFRNVAWTDEDSYTYYNALKTALNASDRRPELPDTYEQVEYIKSTGTQYIILDNILSQVPFNVKAKASFQEQDTKIISAYGSTGDSRYYCTSFVNNFIACRIGNNNWLELIEVESRPLLDKVYQTEMDLSYSGSSVVVTQKYDDGQKTATYTAASTANITGNTLNIFRFAFDGSVGLLTLYDIVLKAGSATLFDGIPCYRKSDNKTGLYDAVSNTFFPNEGTGEFVVGEIIH